MTDQQLKAAISFRLNDTRKKLEDKKAIPVVTIGINTSNEIFFYLSGGDVITWDEYLELLKNVSETISHFKQKLT